MISVSQEIRKYFLRRKQTIPFPSYHRRYHLLSFPSKIHSRVPTVTDLGNFGLMDVVGLDLETRVGEVFGDGVVFFSEDLFLTSVQSKITSLNLPIFYDCLILAPTKTVYPVLRRDVRQKLRFLTKQGHIRLLLRE